MALNSIIDRTLDSVRSGLGQATRAGRGAANQGIGLTKRFANRNPKPKQDMDDVTLARKVETTIFRPADVPKGKIDVNAVEGVVWLRGEVKNQKQISEIEAKVLRIPEVSGVENLLHLPKTPAPSRTRGGAKKTTTKKATAKRFDRTPSSEKPKSSPAEPSPSQAATARKGRQAAPLGTKDPDTPATTTSSSAPSGGTGGGSTTGSGS